MIACEVMKQDDTHIATVYMHAIPHVGDQLWIKSAGLTGKQRHFRVVKVGHWLKEDAEVHNMAIYVGEA